MKRFSLVFLLVLMGVHLSGDPGVCDPADELLDQFGKEYEAAKPPLPQSSVNADYKLGQAALGAYYTTKTLGLLYKQNGELMAKYDQMIQKYDKLIEQNKEVIRLLSILAKKEQKE
jgi:hypothetical protein